MTFSNDEFNWQYAQVSLTEAQELNQYLNNYKTKWTAKELLERTKFCQVWNSSVCISEVASKLNTPSDIVIELSKKYSLEGFKLIKFKPGAKYVRTTYLPSPEKIAEECKKLRSNWSPAVEMSKRRCDWRATPVEFNESTTKINHRLPSSQGND